MAASCALEVPASAMCPPLCCLYLQTACMDAAGKSAEQQQESLVKARDRAERHLQQQNLRMAAAQSQQAAVDPELQQQGLMPDVAEGDEAAFAVADADMLKVAAMSIKERPEVLSDAEDELYVNKGGEAAGTQYPDLQHGVYWDGWQMDSTQSLCARTLRCAWHQ